MFGEEEIYHGDMSQKTAYEWRKYALELEEENKNLKKRLNSFVDNVVNRDETMMVRAVFAGMELAKREA